MTQKKTTTKKAPTKKTPKRVQRVERVERVESSKKCARSPSDDNEEESDDRNRKERRSNKNKPADTSRKTAPQKRKWLKGRFSFKSVDFFTNILLIEIMTANPNPLRVLRKEQNRFW